MARYINATNLQKQIQFNINNSVLTEDFYNGAMWVLNQVRQCRREKDVQEVKHGHWIVDPDEGTAWCSSCRDEFEDNGDTIPDYWYYCPHCGAKMDEERTERINGNETHI